ncbi:MAG: bifunctional (p)ppGpp synthetase/guanosine-3',5'-bis(diphosphate) 3'-pyrophosphohydrolase [Desulfovibrionaceae bacterium]
MIRINDILDKVTSYIPPQGVELIRKAYVFSAAVHAGQVRRSGEPYLSHPLEVANKLAAMRLDEATIAAGLLHDTVEDTVASIEQIDELFGEDVADIVDGVTKISQISFDSREQAQAENIRKMILAMAEDIRVLLVKLTDRLHNMRTLQFMKPERQQAIAQETMDIYAPLANRLGLHRIKVELEDLSLKYLKPDMFAQIEEGVHRHQTVGKDYVDRVTDLITKTLKKNRIKARLKGRTKHIYSIYHKMLQQNLTLGEVYDLIAFRVIVTSVKHCYSVLGLVHSMWKPVPGRFKDYISMPKANMYQSLHTTVIGPEGERIEIQIRTEEMHRLAEYGVSAHWLYKEGGKVNAKDAKEFSWLRQIIDWQKVESDSREFLRTLKFDLFKDEVYVFTPGGDVKELPEGATAVDFAYTVHTEVGNKCAGAKVNGKLVPLSTPLQNGDTVEIITDKSRHPSRDWLKFVKTAKARTRVQHYISTEERSRSIALAREMLEKQGRKMGINVQKAFKDRLFEDLAKEFSFKGVDDLLSSVGYARITPQKVLRKLWAKLEEDKDAKSPKPEVKAPPKSEEPKSKAEEGKPKGDSVAIRGVDDVLVRFARCCNPLPGDSIVGYISRGRGMTVHTADCPNVQGMEPERIMSISWEGEQNKPFPAKIRIVCRNVPGLLARISARLFESGVNIDSGSFHSDVEGNTDMIFLVEVRDAAHLYKSIEQLSKVESVIEVVRLTGPAG